MKYVLIFLAVAATALVGCGDGAASLAAKGRLHTATVRWLQDAAIEYRSTPELDAAWSAMEALQLKLKSQLEAAVED